MANLFGAASVLESSQLVVLQRDLEQLKCQLLDLTNHMQGNIIPYCQNHNPMDFEDDECPETCDKKIANTLERLICKHTLLAKEWGPCRLSPTLRMWSLWVTSVSHRIISPSLLLHTLWYMRKYGPGTFVLKCTALSLTSESQIYWKSRGLMSEWCC